MRPVQCFAVNVRRTKRNSRDGVTAPGHSSTPAADHQTSPRRRLDPKEPSGQVARELPQTLWCPAVPRLLLDGRRHPLGCSPSTKIRGQRPGRVEIHPRGTLGRGTDLHHLGQPVLPQRRHDPSLDDTQQCRILFHLDLLFLGQPIEAHFGPLTTFAVAGANHPNHAVATRALQSYLRWRNANARPPTSSPPNAANGPASAANATTAGAPRQPCCLTNKPT